MTLQFTPSQSFGFLVTEISRLVRVRFNAMAEQLGLTLAQARVLVRLAANEGASQTALATQLEVQPITLLRQIDRLEALGLVERRAHPRDRRVQQLHLTERAQPLLEQIMALGREMQEEYMHGLAPAERDALIGALALIRANLSQIVPIVDAIGDADADAAASVPLPSQPGA